MNLFLEIDFLKSRDCTSADCHSLQVATLSCPFSLSLHASQSRAYLALSSSGPFSGQWTAGFASVDGRLLVPLPRSS